MDWQRLFRRKSREGFTVRNSYLNCHGWYLSRERGKALNLERRSMPLLPYSLTDLLDSRTTSAMRVFVRYDMGTYRWFLHRARHVSSLQIDTANTEGRSRFKHRVDLSREEMDKYVSSHQDKFDIAVVDGPEKGSSLNMIIRMLNHNGVFIIVDDQYDRINIDDVQDDLRQAGFRSLEFVNPSPRDGTMKAALFYRDGNVLGI